MTGVELSEAQQAAIGQAVAQAGTLAPGDAAPPQAVTLALDPHVFWRGDPPDVLRGQLQEFATAEVQ
ncbi:hypothetical protein ACFYNO_17935 [Kitasatospora sp. NPDC006697]|uniref:hypothetical protein n=1 Tax=Kitasatospora sp. NPDC006697 TaxID=3364020 RepID=UPI0036B27020